MLDLQRLKLDHLAPSPAPLYARLQEALVAQITDGTLNPGEKLPSERSLQDELGYSRATIRQALRGLIAAGLAQAVPGSGNYVLEPPAPLLAAAQPPALLSAAALPLPVNFGGPTPLAPANGGQTVGLIVGFPSFHLYYSQLATTLNHCLAQAGWGLELAMSGDTPAGMQAALNGMLMRGVRVFSINPLPYVDMAPILDDLLSHGALVQLVGRGADYPHCDFVGVDNELLGYQGTRHLIELGHTGIAYRGVTRHATGRERLTGYTRAMLESGLRPSIYSVSYQQESIHLQPYAQYIEANDSAEDFAARVGRRELTAAFCFNDEVAAQLCDELRKQGLQVPCDCSLVSVDHMAFLPVPTPPLTTFALPGEEIGRRAAELLLRRIGGEICPPESVKLPACFIPRASTAPPPV